MKRKLETQIVMDAISEFGIKPWPKLQTAVALGLKRLRAAKYQERVSAKTRGRTREGSVQDGSRQGKSGS